MKAVKVLYYIHNRYDYRLRIVEKGYAYFAGRYHWTPSFVQLPWEMGVYAWTRN